MTTPIRSGIPTTYADTRFRSRLEARWAAFFDLIGWRWTYEPFDATAYIPDFLIHGERTLLVEVGACATLTEYQDKSAKSDRTAVELGRDVLILGYSPVAWFNPNDYEYVVGGLLGEYLEETPDGPVLDWSGGVWSRCFNCRAIGIVHDYQTFCLRPCNHHQSGSLGEVISAAELEALWRRAGNDTQWNARRPESIGSVITQARR